MKRGLLQPIMIVSVAQILFMDAADHAAVDLGVTLTQEDARARRYSKLANALLRGIAREKADLLAWIEQNPLADLPEWLAERWIRFLRDTGGGGDRACAAAGKRHRPYAQQRG